MEEMHLSRKNHLFNFAIQSLLKSCCVTVEHHAGRYFMKMENNLCPSSTELSIQHTFPISVSVTKHRSVKLLPAFFYS